MNKRLDDGHLVDETEQPIAAPHADLEAQVRAASTFEEAAALALRPMIEIAQAALAASAFRTSARVVRCMLHVRPDDGYRRLVVLEAGGSQVAAVDRTQSCLPSATAWRWVAETGHGVSVDVLLGRVQLDPNDPTRAVSDRRFAEGKFASEESRMRLMERDVSHLYVLPLRIAPDRIDGTISLEVDCRKATGRPFVWSSCREPLQRIADCVAPHLARLPLALAPMPDSDLASAGDREVDGRRGRASSCLCAARGTHPH